MWPITIDGKILTAALGIRCAAPRGMGDMDRKKHDVDIIERVLGGAWERGSRSDSGTRHLAIEVPAGGEGATPYTVELTIGLPPDDFDRRSS